MAANVERHQAVCSILSILSELQTHLTFGSGGSQPIVPPSTRWHTVAMDFVTSLPKTEAGFDAILTVADILTDRE